MRVLEKYRPEHYRAVRAFASKLDNFFYVRLIIRGHATRHIPGDCYVWKEASRIVAFSAVAWLNRDDAWLWGMRVDPAFKNKGVASRFTRAQFRIIRKSGRTWAGLNTLDSRKPKATFRVMEKLGFRLEETQCDDIFWRRPKGIPRPRLTPLPRVLARLRHAGRRTVFFSNDGWFNCRLLPARARWLNPHGRLLDGTPITVVRNVQTGLNDKPYSVTTVNLFSPPADFRAFVPRLLALAPKRGHLVVNYPVEWKQQFRAAARAAIPGLRQNHGTWQSVWRIYGKRISQP
jgi:RimJ/RimL family protein N-acetyltransferase